MTNFFCAKQAFLEFKLKTRSPCISEKNTSHLKSFPLSGYYGVHKSNYLQCYQKFKTIRPQSYKPDLIGRLCWLKDWYKLKQLQKLKNTNFTAIFDTYTHAKQRKNLEESLGLSVHSAFGKIHHTNFYYSQV